MRGSSGPKIMPPWGAEACLKYMMQINMVAIAAELSEAGREPVTVIMVRRLINSPLGKQTLESIRRERFETTREVANHIHALAPRALEEMRRELESPDEEIRHRAAKWILEADGHTPLRKIEVRRRVADEADLEGLTLEELQRRAIAAFKPRAIETTATPVPDEPEGPVQ